MVVDHPFAVGQQPSPIVSRPRLERVPDHPGVHRAALEGGAGVGRRQEDRFDVAVLEAVLSSSLTSR